MGKCLIKLKSYFSPPQYTNELSMIVIRLIAWHITKESENTWKGQDKSSGRFYVQKILLELLKSVLLYLFTYSDTEMFLLEPFG